MTMVAGGALYASESSVSCRPTLAAITISTATGISGRGVGLTGCRHTAVNAIRNTQTAASAALPSASDVVKWPKYRPATSPR